MKTTVIITTIYGLFLLLFLPNALGQGIISLEQFKTKINSYTSDEEAETFLDSLYKSYLEQPQNEELSAILYEVSWHYGSNHLKNYEKAKNASEQAIFHAGEMPLLAGKANYRNGTNWGRLNQWDTAFIYFKIAKDFLEKEDSKEARNFLAFTNVNLSHIYHSKGDYAQVELLNHAALEQFTKTGDTLRMAKAINNLGLVEIHFDRYEKALTYLKQAEALCNSLTGKAFEKTKNFRIDILLKKGIAYEYMDDFNNALSCYENIVKQLPPTSSFALLAQINQCSLYGKHKKYDKAIQIGQTALKTLKTLPPTRYNSTVLMSNTYSKLAEAWQKRIC